VAYSIRYDLIPERQYKPEGRATLAGRQELADAIEAFPWADHLGPFFARVAVAALRKDIPCAFSFEYGRDEPPPEVVAGVFSRIDDIVQGLRATGSPQL
jgi:hypothetical protein